MEPAQPDPSANRGVAGMDGQQRLVAALSDPALFGPECRGVTVLEGTGAFTGADRPVLYVVISRAEVVTIKAIVHEVDPRAFMVIGYAHEALGEGFRPLKS